MMDKRNRSDTVCSTDVWPLQKGPCLRF